MKSSPSYSLVSSDKNEFADREIYRAESPQFRRLRRLSDRSVLWLFALSGIFFGLSLASLLYAYWLEPSDRLCTEKMAAFGKFRVTRISIIVAFVADGNSAPAMEAVEYEWRTFENDFFHPSIYRGSPTLELEKAWDDLWDCAF